MSNSATAVAKSVGRPAINVKFPKNQNFTVNTIFGRLKAKSPITKVTIGSKIKAALAAGTITKVEDRKTGERGRPTRVYRVVA